MLFFFSLTSQHKMMWCDVFRHKHQVVWSFLIIFSLVIMPYFDYKLDEKNHMQLRMKNPWNGWKVEKNEKKTPKLLLKIIIKNENKVKWQSSPKLSPTKLLVHNFRNFKKKTRKSILNFAPISCLKVPSSFVNLPLCPNLRVGKASSLEWWWVQIQVQHFNITPFFLLATVTLNYCIRQC
jgi:hypothetical protein